MLLLFFGYDDIRPTRKKWKPKVIVSSPNLVCRLVLMSGSLFWQSFKKIFNRGGTAPPEKSENSKSLYHHQIWYVGWLWCQDYYFDNHLKKFSMGGTAPPEKSENSKSSYHHQNWYVGWYWCQDHYFNNHLKKILIAAPPEKSENSKSSYHHQNWYVGWLWCQDHYFNKHLNLKLVFHI